MFAIVRLCVFHFIYFIRALNLNENIVNGRRHLIESSTMLLRHYLALWCRAPLPYK